jgi:HK97 family phage portal protein
MSLRFLESRNTYGPTDDFWYRPVWAADTTGKEASPEQALGLSAWYNGISIIAGTIGSLPCKLYRKVGDAREQVTDDPRQWLMFRSPNRWQTAFEWREMAQGHISARGNHYSLIRRDRLGRAVELIPQHPDRVTPMVEGGVLFYRIQRSGGTTDVRMEDMLHMRGLSGDGIRGYSTVSLARRSLGYSLALEGHGSELMGNKARPGGVLKTDQMLKPESRKSLSEQWDSMFSGGGLGKTAVLDAGLSWQQVGFSAEDAQFLESRSFQVTEVARWLNIPPHFLKDLERATFSNVEQQALEFVKHTIRPLAERWEQRLDKTLLDESERGELFFKFSLEALLRGDSATRAAFYQSLFNMAALSPNEIRASEDMNPVPGGDQRFVQLNLVPLDMVAEVAASGTEAPTPADDSEDAQRALRAVETRALELRVARSARNRRRLMGVYRDLLTEAAGRLVRREVRDLRQIMQRLDDGDVAEFLRRVDVWAEGLPDLVRTILGPILRTYIDLVADAAAEEVGIEDLDAERVGNWRTAYVDKLAQGHTTETVGKLRDTVLQTETDGLESATRMIDRWEENRAAAISMREVVTSGGGIAVTVYAMAGARAVWRNTGQENCPYCELLEGKTVSAGERFLNSGDSLDPGGDIEPLTIKRNISHPSAHSGCDCYVTSG